MALVSHGFTAPVETKAPTGCAALWPKPKDSPGFGSHLGTDPRRNQGFWASGGGIYLNFMNEPGVLTVEPLDTLASFGHASPSEFDA